MKKKLVGGSQGGRTGSNFTLKVLGIFKILEIVASHGVHRSLDQPQFGPNCGLVPTTVWSQMRCTPFTTIRKDHDFFLEYGKEQVKVLFLLKKL